MPQATTTQPGNPDPGLVERLGGPTPRRSFLAWSGAAAAGLLVAACGEEERPAEGRNQQNPAADVTLDFKDPVTILNYAYALEQLEAAFYAQATEQLSNPPEPVGAVLQDLQAHEEAHRALFKQLLGDKAIPALTPDFSKVDFSDVNSVLKTAATFENLGVWAYNGAAQFIEPGGPLGLTPLAAAGQIVSVEARHASVINSLANPNDEGAFAPDAFDKALPPSEVLKQAQPFLKTTIATRNLPKGA